MTINERDFCRKVEPDQRYSIVCFTLSDSRANEIPGIVRQVFRHPESATKAKRMGTVIRVTSEEINYYALSDRQVQNLALQDEQG